jgi:hypothetical protein
MEAFVMGLLNDSPYGLLGLLRSGAQYWSPNPDPGAGDANDLPPWARRQQQRLPLSFAGPGLIADNTTSPPNQPGSTISPASPAEAPAAPSASWLPGNRSVNLTGTQPAMPTSPNLTARVLRSKGVPEADIAAGMNDPDLMRQIIIQHYAPGSRRTPAPYRLDARNRFQFNDPSEPLLGPRSQFDPSASQESSSLIQPVHFRCDGFSAGCPNGGTYGYNANYFISRRNLCRDCAIKILGIEDEPSIIQTDTLRNFEKK